ncbi:helix-turn-helix transcriptional regulator [Streptomyces sp. NPDC059863]|uniref:helix-turn-helix transcriptional regulator n=2 Tax=unclassified Streptomyces TaxID=2593676 RepID=UPI003663A988
MIFMSKLVGQRHSPTHVDMDKARIPQNLAGIPRRTEWMSAMGNDQNGCEVPQPVGDWVLSSVQARILEGVAAGFSSGRLSRELHLSSKTIDYHVRVMSDKLQAPNRVSLVSRAFVLQILRTDSWPPRITSETVD